jgi:hypothetical protein
MKKACSGTPFYRMVSDFVGFHYVSMVVGRAFCIILARGVWWVKLSVLWCLGMLFGMESVVSLVGGIARLERHITVLRIYGL